MSEQESTNLTEDQKRLAEMLGLPGRLELTRETPSSVGLEMDSKGSTKPSLKGYCEAGHLMDAVKEALEAWDVLLSELGLPAREPRA